MQWNNESYMIDVIPGILETDLDQIEKKLTLVEGHVQWVQIDIADNTFVPTKTFLDFATFTPLTKSSLSSDLSRGSLSFEAHLMVEAPEKYIRTLADAGFKRIIAHVECHDPRLFLDEAKYESVEVGLAIDAPTELEAVEPFLELADAVLVMTTEAGSSAAPFLPETVEKIKAIHSHFPDLPLAAEGAIDQVTAKLVKEAGASRVIVGGYLFKDPTAIAATLERLKNI